MCSRELLFRGMDLVKESTKHSAYVYLMPFAIRKQLAAILDPEKAWESLGLFFSFFKFVLLRKFSPKPIFAFCLFVANIFWATIEYPN